MTSGVTQRVFGRIKGKGFTDKNSPLFLGVYEMNKTTTFTPEDFTRRKPEVRDVWRCRLNRGRGGVGVGVVVATET